MSKSRKHDLTVGFEPGDPVEIPLPKDWVPQPDSSGTVTVSGLCLVCFGPAIGPPLPVIETEGRAAGIVVECSCGGPHGEDEEPNCGRSWFVSVKEEDLR